MCSTEVSTIRLGSRSLRRRRASNLFVNQGAVALGNLSATLQFADGRYGITGYVRNVTDKEYKTLGAGPNPPSFIATATLGDPRTWGAMLTARF